MACVPRWRVHSASVLACSRGDGDHVIPARSDADQAGAAVEWVEDAFDVAASFQLVDEETGRLLGHLR
jgi:hypothetical protein